MSETHLDSSAYHAAERLLPHNRSHLVLGGMIKPHWIDHGTRFWYKVGTAAGKAFVCVDPEVGSRQPAFDHERLATALSNAAGQAVHASALPFSAIELSRKTVEFAAFDARWHCTLDTYRCEQVDDPMHPPGLLEVVSPDGTHVAFRRGHDLWVRSLEDGREWALTADGTIDYEFGMEPDAMRPSGLLQRLGLPELPPVVVWSPDSARLLTHRTDQRGVRMIQLVESRPDHGGAPQLLTKRYAFPGDERVPLGELVVFDIAAGTTVWAQTDPLAMPLRSPIATNWIWWADDGSAVYYLSQPRDLHALQLHRLDPSTGEVTTVLTERGETRVEPTQRMGQPPIVTVLPGGHEVVWYSQRDGWGHLYLYEMHAGTLRAQLTSGPWAVQEILHIDERERVVYFAASGLVPSNPYRRSVCRIGLDGLGFARITDDDLDHAVTVSPSREYFIDSASTTDMQPWITVRDWDGQIVVELERADISRLVATGWTAPESFCVKAADGTTDIYGVLYRPHGFDADERYPVLDHPYPGPQMNRVSPAFDPGWLGYDAEVMAALGFVVVAVDGRGTPGRSKAFHDASYGRYADAGSLADHIVTLRQLAATRPWMDLDRVGIFGISGGGYASVRAMLDFPDMYKVAVAASGNHDNRYYHLVWAETYDGPPDETTYARASNPNIANKLAGKLLLIHGGMDDNVLPDQTLRLVDRLIAADKDFDLLIIPGGDHVFTGFEHYVNRRKWDYLVRHLKGAEPPVGYRLTPAPIDLEFIMEYFG